MKKLMITSAILLATIFSFAQDLAPSQVPSVVLNSFKKSYPKATDVEWELAGDLYNVEFEIGFADHELWIDAAGKIVKHKEEIKESSLPAAVTATIQQTYPNYRVSDIKKIQAADTIVYELEVKKGNDEWDLTLDAQGAILNKKAS